MGSACCGGRSQQTKAKDEQVSREVFREESKKRGHHFRSVPFDVVVPVHSPALSPGASGQLYGSGNAACGTSFAAFDQTMYTMRGDASLNIGERPFNSNAFNFDTNMSFTNNFTDVNKDVVNMFLKNVKQIAEGNSRTNNMLEESVSLGGAGSEAIAASKLVGAGPNEMDAEDIEYINDGPTFAEKLSRLSEVEEVLRQNIYGSWSMNITIIQLAMLRVVPTLRERRKTWNQQKTTRTGDAALGAEGVVGSATSETTTTTAAAAAAGAAVATATPSSPVGKTCKKAVVVVHAQDLELDRSSVGTEGASPSPQDLFSPAHVDDSPSHPSGKLAAPKYSPSLVGSPSLTVDPLNRSLSRSGFDRASAKVEHYEMLALTCNGIDLDDKVGTKVIDSTWDFLSDDANTNALNQGECLFRFKCGPVKDFDQETLDVMNLFINVSSFADEEKENNTPKVNVYDPEEAAKYVCISVKAMYMLPGVKLANLTPPIISSREYQKYCQPSGNKLEDCDMVNTFRLTIVAIRFVLSFTVMFRVSEITDPNLLFSFKSADGIVPAKAIMLERTKRNVSKVDATAKVRSMLLYYPVNGGVLCNSHTFVLNTSLPRAVAKVVNTFGSSGAAQSAETAKLTRKYMVKTYGDSRKS